MPKEEKDPQSLLIAEKLFTHVSRSRTAGSISPVQCELLRKRLLRSPREDFIWKDVQKAKSDLRGCFQAHELPTLWHRGLPAGFPKYM